MSDERRDGHGFGVLVLAHGGSARWNRSVQEMTDQAKLDYPAEVVFGMGMHAEEVLAMQQALNALKREGISRLIVVPLLVSSFSEVMRQFEYLFGLRDESPWPGHVKPLSLQELPVTLTPPLNDDPIVAEILLERAQALSRAPEEETVILVAHGPNDEEDNARWLQVMGRLAQSIQAQGRFRAVVPVTLRDDALESVKQDATRKLRALVEEGSAYGRSLVVPLLIASGGIEHKIPQRLQGLSYAFQENGLLPHPKLSQWLVQRVQQQRATVSSSDEEASVVP